jgi:ABC-2 type transport system permease protein
MKMLRLIGLQLKVNFGLSALRWYLKHDLKKFLSSLGIIALMIVGVGPLFFLYLRLVQEMYKVAFLFGQTEVVLASSLVLSSLLVLFFGLAFVMSVFYFSRDLSLLVPLPLLPRQILGAKFSVVLIYDYLTVLPFYLPALWVYGANSGAGPLYWLAGAAVFFLAPVIPLALASTFILFLMRVTNLSRSRDTLRLIGLFAFLAILLTFNFFITGIPAGEEAEFIARILLDEQGLLRHASRVYPPALFATRALTAGGSEALLNFTYYLGISLAGIALVLLIGQALFYRGLIGGAEVRGGKVISRETLARKTAGTSSPAWAIAMREIKYLVRTPIYLFNSLALLAIVPLVLVIPIITGGGVAHLLASLRDAVPRVVQIMGAAGITGVMALFLPAASSSFSREGKLFWISQVIPVSPQDQLRGKILYSLLVSSLALPLVALAAVLLLPWSLPELVLALFGGLVLSFPAITLSLLIDLLRPYLTWDSPQKAIKQNINVVLAMVAGGGLFYLLYLAGRSVYLAAGAALPVYPAVLGAAAVAGGIFYGVLLKIAPARYKDITV